MSHSSTSSPLLRVTALNVGFRQQPLLHNISFDLDYGEVLALVGESGSGKSLTALSIIGLLPAAAQIRGSIHFAGRDLLTADARALHSLRGKNIAMIFQDARQALDPLFTIGQQLTETLHRHYPGLRRQQAQQQAITLLEEVEIANAASQYHAYPHQLSGGQCQRVMIAIALAGQPQLLIADEPTTALDVTVQKEILQLLRHIRQQRAIAILLITHDMGVVADSADRVLVLRDGRMTEQATVSALFSQPQTAYSRQLLDAVLRLETPQHRQPDGASAPPVTIDRLQVDYSRRGKKFTALQDISLTLEAGSTLGIVGESGSGKSTLGRALAGLVPIAAGDIYLDGIPLRQASPAQWLILRRKIGMVFQSPRSAINPRFTLQQAIAEPLQAHTSLSWREIQQRVAALLEQVGLDVALAARYPHQISGGQCQRVAIARALALKPALLIADEPTSALDVSVQATILNLLKNLQRELKFSCLLISHDLAVVSQLCQKVAVLQHGELMEYGDTAAVLHRPQHAYTRQLVDCILPLPQ